MCAAARLLGIGALLSCAGALALPPDGQLDSTFNGNGKALISFAAAGYTTANLFGIAKPGSGKHLLLGEPAGGSEFTPLELARLLSDGTPDPTFGNIGIATNAASPGLRSAIADLNGGVLLIHTAPGLIGSYGTVCRVLNSGAADNDYGCVTPAPGGQFGFNGGALQPDGALIVAGFAISQSTGFKQALLVRISSSGMLDASGFASASNGYFTDACASAAATTDCEFTAVTVAKSGQIYAAGEATLLEKNPDTGVHESEFIVAALTSAGALDGNFGSQHDGKEFIGFDANGHDRPLAIALSTSGQIAAAGYAAGFTPSPQKSDGAITILSAQGQPVIAGRTSVGTASHAYNSQIAALAFQTDGRLLLVGATELSSGSGQLFAVQRLTADNLADTNFADGSGYGTLIDFGLDAGSNASANAVTFDGTQPTIAGTAILANGDSEFAIVRLTSELTFANGFD